MLAAFVEDAAGIQTAQDCIVHSMPFAQPRGVCIGKPGSGLLQFREFRGRPRGAAANHGGK
jgi:hypothetical protein